MTRRPRPARTQPLIVLLVLAMLGVLSPAATVTAQTPALERAFAYLRDVPGLDVSQLSVFGDAIGDAEPGADAAWGATGEIGFRNRLRRWLKGIVDGETGWGRLPARGTRLLITFVGMEQAPSTEGDATAIVHLGLGGPDQVIRPGHQLDPGNGAGLVHTFGLWRQDGRAFTQNGTSPVTDTVQWFASQAEGAGGIDLPAGVILNVVPLEKRWNRYRFFTESTSPTSSAPNGTSRDLIMGNAGIGWIGRGGHPGEPLVECLSTFVAPRALGGSQLVVNLQSGRALDAASLADGMKLRPIGADGADREAIEGRWASFPSLGLHRAIFTIADADATMARIVPGGPGMPVSDTSSTGARAFLAASDEGAEAADPAATADELATAHDLILVLEGFGFLTGLDACGKLATDLDACDDTGRGALMDEMATAMATALGLDDPDEVDLGVTIGAGPDGSIVCDFTVDDQPVARAVFGSEPVRADELSLIAESSGCPFAPADGTFVGSFRVTCEALDALLWFHDVSDDLRLSPDDERAGIVVSLVLFDGPTRPAELLVPPTLEPAVDVTGRVVVAGVLDAIDALAGQAEWRLAVRGDGAAT